MLTEYDRGFKEGVIRATEQLYGGYNTATVPIRDVNSNLMSRRKKLLTRKVTKWFFLIQYCLESEVWRIKTEEGSGDGTSIGKLYDSKELAEADMRCFLKPSVRTPSKLKQNFKEMTWTH